MSNSFTRSGLLGDLLQDPLVAAAFSAEQFTAFMVAFERAWTEAMMHANVVDSDTGQAALAAIDMFQPDFEALGRASLIDGLPVPALVKQLRAGLPDDVQMAIHSGATSQDVIDTATVLTSLRVLKMFGTRLDGIADQLDDVIARFGPVQMMGRTRMQAGLPITVQDRVRPWRQAVLDHRAALVVLIENTRQVQIGGAVGLRNLPAGKSDDVAAHVAQTLGLRLGPVWHAERTMMIEIGHWLTKVSGSLGKIGQDIALMAQQGVDEIKLDGAGGSSAMPHKQNPIRAEILIALARSVAGQQGILAQALVHEQERSGAAWTLEWMTLPSMMEDTGASLNNAAAVLSQIKTLGQTPSA